MSGVNALTILLSNGLSENINSLLVRLGHKKSNDKKKKDITPRAPWSVLQKCRLNIAKVSVHSAPN